MCTSEVMPGQLSRGFAALLSGSNWLLVSGGQEGRSLGRRHVSKPILGRPKRGESLASSNHDSKTLQNHYSRQHEGPPRFPEAALSY